MALIITRTVRFHSPRFFNTQFIRLFLHSTSIPQNPRLRTPESSILFTERDPLSLLRLFSTQNNFLERSPLEEQPPTNTILLKKLESTLKAQQLEESWVTFNDLKNLYGFPDGNLVGELLTEMSYSSDPLWLRKARNLVLVVSRDKPGLLGSEVLSKLALSMARRQMPGPAGVIIRIMLKRGCVPPLNFLRLVFSHLVKSEVGACLAANLLVEVCGFVIGSNGCTKKGHFRVVRPDAMLFNLVLDACFRFNQPLKGQQMVELMARVGVVADAHSVVVVSRVHEMNGLRDEVKKFKDCVDQVCAGLVCHYQQYYESLLNLHFKFDDIDAASKLLLELKELRGSVSHKFGKEVQKPYLVLIGSRNLKNGLKLLVAPELLNDDFVFRIEKKRELLVFRDGILLPSNRALGKLILGFKRHGRIVDLSKILLSLQRDFKMQEGSCLCADVIAACINLGWLESAHDILDDAETARVSIPSSIYLALLTGYQRKEMFKEAEALVKQMKRAGLVVDLSREVFVSSSPPQASSLRLTNFIVREMKEEKALPSAVYELNSSIYFFCKAKMVGDALNTYRRLQEVKIQPTAQTFAYLVQGYSVMGKFRDITIIWGDVKRNIKQGQLVVSRDLYEFLVLNFLRGGYFERVMEVISYMRERNMYVDKLMFKDEFLKLHKNLYKNLKSSEARTEAQSERLGYVRMFRKWAGIY